MSMLTAVSSDPANSKTPVKYAVIRTTCTTCEQTTRMRLHAGVALRQVWSTHIYTVAWYFAFEHHVQ